MASRGAAVVVLEDPVGEPCFRVIPVRATGVVPEAVAERIESLIEEQHALGLVLNQVEPVIYNSSTTGYFLLFFKRRPGSKLSSADSSNAGSSTDDQTLGPTSAHRKDH